MLSKIMRLYRSGTLGLAIKGELGGWVSHLGDKVGSERIIYNPWTYASIQRVALETSPVLIEGILNLFPHVKNVVDFGCGTGVHLAEFKKREVIGEGFEYSEIPRQIARKSYGLEIRSFDLTTFTNIGRTFDLCISIEVAEHVSPELGERLVDACCQHAPLIIFSAAHPGQPGQGHIHLQPKSYWIERFERRGFRYDKEKSCELGRYLKARLIRGFWLADNVGIYETGSEMPSHRRME